MPKDSYRHRINARACIVRDDKILLIAYDDESGFHYNLPGGGVEAGENLYEAIERECLEEANAKVVVGDLLLVMEFVPELDDGTYGNDHRDLGLIFRCELVDGTEPELPENPDPNQVAVDWISKEDFPNVMLYPRLNQLILDRLTAQDLDTAFSRDV